MQIMAWRLNNPSHNLAMVGSSSSSSPAPPPIPLYHAAAAAAETGDMKLVHNHMPPIPGNFLFILHSFVHSYSYSSYVSYCSYSSSFFSLFYPLPLPFLDSS